MIDALEIEIEELFAEFDGGEYETEEHALDAWEPLRVLYCENEDARSLVDDCIGMVSKEWVRVSINNATPFID